MAPKPRPLAERAWPKVDRREPDDCWFWTGARTSTGYGNILVRPGVWAHAHRVIWELTNGPIPDGMQLAHSCDVRYAPGDKTYRACVNPAHLFLATNAENLRWMRDHGRASPPPVRHPDRPRGERHGRAKLTEADVAAIRATWMGKSIYELASTYGVAPQTIHRIIARVLWKHLP